MELKYVDVNDILPLSAAEISEIHQADEQRKFGANLKRYCKRFVNRYVKFTCKRNGSNIILKLKSLCVTGHTDS